MVEKLLILHDSFSEMWTLLIHTRTTNYDEFFVDRTRHQLRIQMCVMEPVFTLETLKHIKLYEIMINNEKENEILTF